MERICHLVDRFYAEFRRSPSMSEIGEALGISKATAYRYLLEMHENGMISYDGSNRKLVTSGSSKTSPNVLVCPLLGAIPCGPVEQEEEKIEDYIDLPVAIFGGAEGYMLRASGDSMEDAGIEDGDYVFIRNDCEARKGDIIAALTGENESTLKEYGGIDEKTGEAVLYYRNEEKYPGAEIRVKHLSVQGVCRNVIKKL